MATTFCFVKSYANQHPSVVKQLPEFQTLKRWVSLKPKVNELQFYFLIRKISNLKSKMLLLFIEISKLIVTKESKASIMVA